MKKCTRCLIEKDYTEFSPRKNGFTSRCKNCIAEVKRNKYVAHPLPKEGNLKICSICEQNKSINQFYLNKNCATHRSECKKCSSIRRINFKNKVKLLLIELKSKPCMDCNISYPYYVMDFDHREGEVKKYNISQMRFNSKEKLLEEISKCDLVCANCHRQRSFNRMKK